MREEFQRVAELVSALSDAIDTFNNKFEGGEDDDGGTGFVLIPEKELSQPIGIQRNEKGCLEFHFCAWDNNDNNVFKGTSLADFFAWNEEVYSSGGDYFNDLKELRDAIQAEMDSFEDEEEEA